MNRTIRAIIAVLFILIIVFSAISICQNIGRRLKLDVTEQKIYTLSNGTKTIVGKLNQPLRLKLYYAKTAAMKAPDQIKFFNNYYEFVKALLEEYVAAAKGMITLEIIDPRPFSDEEVEATRYGLRKFPITEEESFFFGLVVQTQFGVEKSIPFFSPDRQNFIEYDISYLIDNAITRQKKTIGVLSSAGVMGDDVSGYMAQMMRMQGQQPRPAWTIIEQLRQQYEVKSIPAEVNEINDIDILLVIQPKNLVQRTLFAIDQFILRGGRTIVCIDPYSFADQPNPALAQMGTVSQSSQLKTLLNAWGLEMPENTFAGDRDLAVKTQMNAEQRAEKLIGFLDLVPPGCFNRDNVVTAQLNRVRMLFAGVLKETASPNDVNEQPLIERIPLITTTGKGNSFAVSSQFELQMLDAASMMESFVPGGKPVVMGYLLTGRFKSSFPEGIEVSVKSEDPEDPNKTLITKTRVTGITESPQDCAVIVFSDVDFISDLPGLAYQNTIFGKLVVGDNSALLMNAIDELGGSSELISIRSRGSIRKPFVRVDEIEAKAEAETAEQVARLNTEIAGFEQELRTLLTTTKEEQKQIIGSTIVQKTRDLEIKKLNARRQLRKVNMMRRERIEHLGNTLRNFNMLIAPAVILAVAIVLGVRRSVMKRHYISHASDA